MCPLVYLQIVAMMQLSDVITEVRLVLVDNYFPQLEVRLMVEISKPVHSVQGMALVLHSMSSI